MKYFTLSIVLKRLKELGLPSSRMIFISYEKAGRIPVPENYVEFRHSDIYGKRVMRIYREDEVNYIVESYKRLYPYRHERIRNLGKGKK